jgi:uncharacterized protein
MAFNVTHRSGQKAFIVLLTLALLAFMTRICIADEAEDFIRVVKNGDMVRVKALLSENPRMANEKDALGMTALMWASGLGYKKIAVLLIAHGADVNTRASRGTTALMYAATDARSKEMVELLIAKGADVNAKDKDGRRVLKLALMGRQKDIAELLRRHGAKE